MKKYSSLMIAAVIALAAIIWIGSGQMQNNEPIIESAQTPSNAPQENADKSPPPQVRYIISEVKPFHNVLRLTGSTEPYRTITIRAETDGTIQEMNARMGGTLDAGAIIARLDQADRPSQLARAKALLDQANIENNASERLANKGFQTQINQSATTAALASAKADLARIELDIKRTVIRAPYPAVVQQNFADVGDFVSRGDPIVELIDLNPLLLSFEVSEQERPLLRKGVTVNASLINGQKFTGKLTNIAALSDPQTRTFAIDVEIANPDFKHPAGLTAKVEIPTQTQQAHAISPAWLTLADGGAVGVKWLDGDEIRFTEVEILADLAHEMWIKGLPNRVKIITVGQEYVMAGAVVNAIEDDIAK